MEGEIERFILGSAQWLRALVAVPGDQGLVLSNHVAAHNCLFTTISGDLVPSSGLRGYLHWWFIEMQEGKAPIHIKPEKRIYSVQKVALSACSPNRTILVDLLTHPFPGGWGFCWVFLLHFS